MTTLGTLDLPCYTHNKTLIGSLHSHECMNAEDLYYDLSQGYSQDFSLG